MAGPYSHCLVSRESLKIFNDPTYRQFYHLNDDGFLPYIFLSSVSPDYPYPACILTGINPTPDQTPCGELHWGDKMHKQNTGDFMKNGLTSLRGLFVDNYAESLKLIAWLMGYYSHIITDTVVHAVIYNIVGKYEDHKTQHRYCEMVEDSFIFLREENQELVKSDFIGRYLKQCQILPPFDITEPLKPSEFILDPKISSFWDGILKETYGTYYNVEKPNIDAWHREYLKVNYFAVSTFGRTLGDILGESKEAIAYEATDQIPQQDVEEYYTNMKIPGPDKDKRGNYLPDVFDYAVKQVMAGWGNLLKSLTDDNAFNAMSAALVNIDLDTGTTNCATGGNYILWPGGKTTDWQAQ